MTTPPAHASRSIHSLPRTACWYSPLLAALLATRALAQPGTAPTGDPGGFGIDGDLMSNTPAANVSDWVSGPPGGGIALLSNAGTPLASGTFHAVDAWDSSDLIFNTITSKLNGNPSATWAWITSGIASNDNLGNGLAHFSRAADDHLWCTWSLDLRASGTTVLNAELLQGSLVRNANGTFTSSGTQGGRTVGDLVLSVLTMDPTISDASFHAAQWTQVSPGVYDYASLTPAAGTSFVAMNLATTAVPYGAFGLTTYGAGQFAEAAVDLTALLATAQPVASFQTLFFSDRSSLSSGAAMLDFLDPIPLQINVGVADGPVGATAGLRRVTPNPSRGPVEVEFALSRSGPARLEIFDVAGRRVAELARGELTAGEHTVRWQAGRASAGLHFVRLTTAEGTWSRRFTIVP